GRIKKGAKAATIVFWNMIVKDTGEVNDEGEPIKIKIPMLKTYQVFSVRDDCEGLTVKHQPEPQTIRVPLTHFEPVAGGIDASAYNPAAEAVIADYLGRAQTLTLEREHSGDRAYYSPTFDKVVVPNVTQFKDVAEFYSTLFHELGHSTGHASRLNRFSGKDAAAAFGDESYSREELVAEITAASILSALGMENGNSFRNSAAYVKHWSEHIQKDPMMFITAAGRAEKAINLILNQ
ncbi:MAG: hypothetical protein J5553_05180, partial [Verrucomicrobia bacterium]|nr:hypothetical protein [Verrucomicrobiota bacterium]